MVSSLSGNILAESLRLSCPSAEAGSFASRAVRVRYGGQDPRTTGGLQAVVAWRDCPLADRVGFGYSATRDPENEESYCFAPQLVQNEFPGASGTPQERHFAVAVATAGACTGAEGEGLYWRVACAAGAY